MTKPPKEEEKPSLLDQLKENDKNRTPVKQIKDERQPAPSSETSEGNKKKLSEAMVGKVEPKKTSSKEPKAKKKEEPESTKTRHLHEQ